MTRVSVGILIASMTCLGATETRADDGEWVEYLSGDLVAYSACDDDYTVELLEQLHQFRTRLFGVSGTESGAGLHVPLLVFLYGDYEDFAEHTGRDGFGGFFVDSGCVNHIVMFRPRSGSALRTVFHEYVHFYLSRRFASVPRWLHEGIATYYETARIERDRIEIGRPPPLQLAALRSARLVPMARFVGASVFPSADLPGSRQSILYAQAWLLTHWLCTEQPRGEASIVDILARVGRGELAEDALQEVTGLSLAELDRELAGYAARTTMATIEIRQGGNPASEFSFARRAVPDAEMTMLLREMQAYTREEGDLPLEELGEIAAANPDLGIAQRTYGVALLRSGETTRAITALKAAAQADPDDLLAHYLVARETIAPFWKRAVRATRPIPTDNATDDAKKHLLECLRLDPRFSETYLELARCAVLDRSPSSMHVRTMGQVWASSPGRADIGIVLFQLYMDLPDLENASAMLLVLARSFSASREVRGSMSSLVWRYLDAVSRLAEEGDSVSAVRHYRRYEELAASCELREGVLRRGEELGKELLR